MRVLIIHQNFPGQFRYLIRDWIGRSGWTVLGIGGQNAPGLAGIRVIKHRLHRQALAEQHPYLRQMENAVLHGQAVARLLIRLKKEGFSPDVVLAHPGWGETLFVRDVFPDTYLVHFCEWYYGVKGSEFDFDPEFPTVLDDHARVRAWNALHLLNLETCHKGVSPTPWQKRQHPLAYSDKISVIHEGIDTENLAPDSASSFKTPAGNYLRSGDTIITYVARNLEPCRGFHSFMRSLEIIQRAHPSCHAVIVGGDNTSYGRPPKDAPNWREKMLREVKIDPSRTHFLGRVPYDTYRKILQVSMVHVYLTYPFVLSWSMLEAMASGCLVIGSRTPPVEEVIVDGANGLLVDFFNKAEIANRVLEVLEHPERYSDFREQARIDVRARFSRDDGLKGYEALLERSGLREGAYLKI